MIVVLMVRLQFYNGQWDDQDGDWSVIGQKIKNETIFKEYQNSEGATL